MEARSWVFLGLVIAFVVVFVKVFSDFYHQDKVPFDWVKFIARVAIFGAISTLLYIVPVFQIQLFFLPSFVQLHFDEIPAFIAGFAYGPWTAFAILIIKALIKLPMSTTLGVGELADVIYSSVFILPAVWIYQKKRNLKGVALGFGVSTALQLVVTSIVNVYAMLPFYEFMFNMTPAALLGACQAVNPAIQDLGWGYTLYVNLPLNLIKDAIVIAVTFIVYRSIHKLLHFDRSPQKFFASAPKDEPKDPKQK
jgi:riboflavin transporter